MISCRTRHAVALIGDSFVEASMLPAQERPGAQLERALVPTRPVYAMGVPGTALLDYAERIRLAHERFGVRDFVLLMERFDVRQSFCGSGNVGGSVPAARHACRSHRTAAAGRHRQADPAAFGTGAVRVQPAQAGPVSAVGTGTAASTTRDAGAQGQCGAGGASSTEPSLQEMARHARVTETFFDRIRPYRDGRLVIVLDSDRSAIRRGEATPGCGA